MKKPASAQRKSQLEAAAPCLLLTVFLWFVRKRGFSGLLSEMEFNLGSLESLLLMRCKEAGPLRTRAVGTTLKRVAAHRLPLLKRLVLSFFQSPEITFRSAFQGLSQTAALPWPPGAAPFGTL